MAGLDDLFHIDHYVGPEPLTNLCFKLIGENLDIISVKNEHGHRVLREGLCFPSEICDKIIEYALRADAIDDYVAFFSIFQNLSATKLKHVKLSRCISTDYLIQILAKHKLVDLELIDCQGLSKASFEHINANSENLRSLICHDSSLITPEVPSGSGDYWEKGYVFKAPNLRRLALGYATTPFMEYTILLAGLPNLTHLDLSNNFQVSDFSFCDQIPHLVSLTLFNCNINNHAQSFVNNVCHLKELRHLDISQFHPEKGRFENPNKILSDLVVGLPKLVSLDIGGTNLAGTGVAQCLKNTDYDKLGPNVLCDIPGLATRINNPLQFLGLYGTAHAACRRHDIPAKMIAGDANEDQILIAARVCMDNKQDLLQKVISDLYYVFRYENSYRMHQVLFTVLEAMEKHPAQKPIQISGSATLFYIVKSKEKGELDVAVKKRIVSTLLAGMSIYKDEETMMRNGCLALCQFRIPQDVMSNYEPLVKILLHSVKQSDLEGFVQRIAIYLLNSLACQVEGRDKRLLGNLGCVETLLKLVECKVQSARFDDALEIAWSTLWNMTDETPINCQRFLDENGLVLFLKCVRQYPHKEELLRNMMGLLGNVAEVEDLRVHLMRYEYVNFFTNVLRAKSASIEVSYNAAGILAHMASNGAEAWTVPKPTRNEVLEYMVQAINRWELSAERNINYRSFLPLLRLLDVYHTPQCQHWAVWALANLTKVYPNKYCALVVKEGGIEKLNALILDPRPYERIKALARYVCDNCWPLSRGNQDTDLSPIGLD